MNTENSIKIHALRFPVTVEDEGGEVHEVHIIFTKDELRAAQMIGQSSKELILRHFGRQGLFVENIGKPERKALIVDLDELWGR